MNPLFMHYIKFIIVLIIIIKIISNYNIINSNIKNCKIVKEIYNSNIVFSKG